MVPWVLLTLVFDGSILYGIARQLHAKSYPSVEGTILQGEVKSEASEDGPTYKFEVRYAYAVDGRQYESSRHRYGGGWSTSDKHGPVELATRFAKGTRHPVYYRAGDPSDAVLLTGVEGSDLFLLLFMTPFNLVTYVGLSWLVGARKRQEEGVRSFVRDGRTHVPLKVFHPLAAGLVAAGTAAFVLVFPIAFTVGMNPPLPVAVLALVAVGVVGVAVAQWRRGQRDSGEDDLILDEQQRKLLLPVSSPHRQRREVRWRDVLSVSCQPHSEKDSDGDVWTKYQAVLELTGANGQRGSEVILEWNEKSRVEELVAWLRGRLKLPAPAASQQASA